MQGKWNLKVAIVLPQKFKSVIRFWILDFGFWIDLTDKFGGLYHQEIFGQELRNWHIGYGASDIKPSIVLVELDLTHLTNRYKCDNWS
jgi:hypothetical protein